MASKACAVSPGPSSRITGSDRRRPPLRHVEAAEALGLLVGHVNVVDLRAPRALAQEAHHRVDRLLRALHAGFARPAIPVAPAARDAQALSTPARRVAEEHALVAA